MNEAVIVGTIIKVAGWSIECNSEDVAIKLMLEILKLTGRLPY